MNISTEAHNGGVGKKVVLSGLSFAAESSEGGGRNVKASVSMGDITAIGLASTAGLSGSIALKGPNAQVSIEQITGNTKAQLSAVFNLSEVEFASTGVTTAKALSGEISGQFSSIEGNRNVELGFKFIKSYMSTSTSTSAEASLAYSDEVLGGGFAVKLDNSGKVEANARPLNQRGQEAIRVFYKTLNETPPPSANQAFSDPFSDPFSEEALARDLQGVCRSFSLATKKTQESYPSFGFTQLFAHHNIFQTPDSHLKPPDTSSSAGLGLNLPS